MAKRPYEHRLVLVFELRPYFLILNLYCFSDIHKSYYNSVLELPLCIFRDYFEVRFSLVFLFQIKTSKVFDNLLPGLEMSKNDVN